MSALQKLAVGGDVGTSRPVTTPKAGSKGQHQQNDSHDNPPQQALLHPLLQSLDFKLPASLQTTERVQNASNNHASPAGMAEPTPSNNSSKKQQPGHNLLPCTAQSAAALAQALRRNPAMLLGSNSTGQLLASLATEQQREQLRAHQRMGLLNPRQRLQEHGVTTGHNAVSGAYSHSSAAQIAPFAKPQRHPARPVTPHKTKPYRSGSVKQPACNALEQQSGKPAAQAAGVRVNSHRPLTAGDNRACKVQQPSSALERPSTATMIRPGSAAASKLLRSMEPGSPRRRPDSAAGGMSCSTGGQLCQNLVEVIGGPAITNDSSSTASLTDNHQQQQGSSELESSRPTTAAMRALLMSRSGHDPAVLERLAWYARINSANDSTEGLDIVHETAEDDDNETQEFVPDWLASDEGLSSAAAQAAAMVLNLEDVTQSTPEVLEKELDVLNFEQLQQLMAILKGSQ